MSISFSSTPSTPFPFRRSPRLPDKTTLTFSQKDEQARKAVAESKGAFVLGRLCRVEMVKANRTFLMSFPISHVF